MLNLPQSTLNKIKSLLTQQEAQIQEELKSIDKDDPVMMIDAVAEATEPGTESYHADIHSRLTAAKNDLTVLLGKVRISLVRINKGTYGICEKCAKAIEPERLKAMPTATLCVSCSKKSA
jgi:DnaK suppressor protein